MSKPKHILLIEDEPGLVLTISDRLTAEGYQCDTERDGKIGFEKAKNGSWDLLLLDVMLPEKNGFDICRDLRAQGFGAPILMLTARSQIIDRVLGLKLGADDYLCKPFDMNELLARIEALLRRSKALDTAIAAGAVAVTFGAAKTYGANDTVRPNTGSDASAYVGSGNGAASATGTGPEAPRGKETYTHFTVDFQRGTVEHQGLVQNLSAQEYKLLAYLTRHPGEIISRDTLLDAVWGYGTETTTRTVDVHVAWLRKKIGDTEPAPYHIQTIRGLGYRFNP
ncbi:response regulator transcription factor [Gracilinema caldarium]|uniref:response regulator transcription factor n=1 Tax=Gracilinema caldarium TaxID=215591 RepID=UPI0026F0A066|nr:response regulator transcription factor [Gracilinema caldarium]